MRKAYTSITQILFMLLVYTKLIYTAYLLMVYNLIIKSKGGDPYVSG